MTNVSVNIFGITGQSPYDIYICQSDVNNCIYINTISGTTYSFDLPKPMDNGLEYIVKVIDNNNRVITSIENVSNS
jgi:hypothetical protein